MLKSELLDELDTYFKARSNPVSIGSLGLNVITYNLKALLERSNNVSEEHEINFHVFKEGTAEEVAYYSGDPLNHVFRKKVIDFVNEQSGWIGTVHSTMRPRAICKVVKDPAIGEIWIQVTETAPNTYVVADVSGTVLT